MSDVLLFALYYVGGATAFWLGAARASPRKQRLVFGAAIVVLASCAAALLAQVWIPAPFPLIVAAAVLVDAAFAAFVLASAMRPESVARMLAAEARFSYEGGQQIFSLPRGSGFNYRPWGLVMLALGGIYLYFIVAPIFLVLVEPPLWIYAAILGPWLCHVVVGGRLFRLATWAVGAPAA